MKIGSKIKQIRKTLDLTQSEFAEKISSSHSTVAKYEANVRTPAPSTIDLICNIFKVNKDWLLTGNGEMFIPDTDDELEKLAEHYDLSKSAKIVIKQFAKLPTAVQEEFISFFKNVCAELSKDESETVEVTSSFTQEQIRQIMQQIPQDPAEFFKSKKTDDDSQC